MERTKRTAMVTGGSRGIGAAAVRFLAREGWQVAVGCCQNLDRAQALCKELTAAGAEVFPFQGDVASATQMESFAKELQHRSRKIDL